MARCPNGFRKNKKTQKCTSKNGTAYKPSPSPSKSLTKLLSKKHRCKNGTRRNKKTGNCEKYNSDSYWKTIRGELINKTLKK
jgi:hypothetical protein